MSQKIGIYKEHDNWITRYKCSTFRTWVMHWHKEIEIVHLLDGPCSFMAGEKLYHCNAGDFVVFRGCEPHKFITPISRKMQICKFNISLMYGLSKKFQYPKTVITSEEISRTPGLNDELCRAFDKLGEVADKKGSDLIADSYTVLLFCLLSENFPSDFESTVCDADAFIKLHSLFNYIDKNYSKAITLQELGDMVNYSKSHVSFLFSKYSGMSYKEYLDRVRISHATSYIEKSEKTFAEISALCGFVSIRTFNNVFKRIMGCTPTEYKASHINTKS